MLTILFAAVLAATTPSQPPVPSQGKVSQPEQPQSQNKPSVADQDHGLRNDRASPNLTFAPRISVVTSESPKGGKQEPSADWWLVIFTGGLLIAAVVTYFTFRRQAKTMANTLEQMKTDAAARAKEFETQIGLVDEQVKLARDEFNASHRPKLRVRQFRNVSKTPGDDFEIHFVCANVGDSPCDILE